MDVHDKLDEIVALVENARAMPMSASCLINRGEMLELLDDLRHLLPAELGQAEQLLGDRQAVLEEGRRAADRMVEGARAERDRLVSDTEVYAEAQRRAQAQLVDARAEIEQMREEVDEYIDARLANFEVVLTKTLAAVTRGREKLGGHSEWIDLADGDEAPDERSIAGPID